MGSLFSFFSYKTDSSPVADTSPNREKKKSDCPCTLHEKTPGDTSRTENIFQPTSDHIEDVDKRNIYVINCGKSREIIIFPYEKLSYLLEQACEHFRKQPECMKLIFEGEQLDGTMTVNHYPRLRGGSKVNLIRAA